MNFKLNFSFATNKELDKNLLNQIFKLNQNNIPALGEIKDLKTHFKLSKQSKYCIYKINNDDLIAFALVMDQSSNYKSSNYLYFRKKFNEFLYIDRIAIADSFQRKGIGHSIYQELFKESSGLSIPLCCEVNTYPVNQPSLNFHKNKFQVIDEISFGEKKVAMLVKLPN